MNTVISSSTRVDVHDAESVSKNRAPLLAVLQTAAQRATQIQKGILVSYTYPIAWYDTLRSFTAARQTGLGACFFWEQSTTHHALVGIGATSTIETRGKNSFADAASQWRTLLESAVVGYAPETAPLYGSGPVFFGGFAFDPLRPRTALWADFPDGLLTLPSLLLSYHEGQAALTINTIVQPDDDVEQLGQGLLQNTTRLCTAIEQTPVQDYETSSSTALTLQVRDNRPANEWMKLVAETTTQIRQGVYEKVVLARSVEVTPTTDDTFDISAVLFRLRQSYPGAYVFAQQRGERFFVGATPERLVQAQGGQIQTMALAGSAPRGATEEEDRKLGDELLHSTKNNTEHALVVEKIRESLLAHCTEVSVSDKPQLLQLKNVQHLQTPIVGELIEGRCILDVMTGLHPTPAVGGVPTLAALEAIRSTELLDRGWYAGPLGWIGAGGHGEFAVALRSGLVESQKAILFAGCGIVADSDPQTEYAESCLKLQAMLRGLGGKN